MKFGDSGIDLELRIWIQDPENGLWLDTVQAVARHIRKQRNDTREF